MIDRIKNIMTAKYLKRPGFAAAIGVSKGTLDGYLDGRRKPSLPLAEGILRAYPDISAEWLMRGEGSMYRDKQPTTNYEIYSHSHNNSHSNFEGGYNESNGTTADATCVRLMSKCDKMNPLMVLAR